MRPAPAASATTIDPEETARFAAIAAEWWDPRGKFRPLHALNPARIRFIRDKLAAHFGRLPLAPRPLDGLRLLDIGCGGGLIAEPMARLGATVVGIDAVPENIRVAGLHAAEANLAIDYRVGTAEDLAGAGERFDAVLALEIVEHVADLPLFFRACADLVRPGGAFILSTLNRTVKSLLLGKIGAEYVLRWLPRGTHDWRRFLTPTEAANGLHPYGLHTVAVTGLAYSLLTDEWVLSPDTDVNYLLFAVKEGAPA